MQRPYVDLNTDDFSYEFIEVVATNTPHLNVSIIGKIDCAAINNFVYPDASSFIIKRNVKNGVITTIIILFISYFENWSYTQIHTYIDIRKTTYMSFKLLESRYINKEACPPLAR